MNYKLWTINFLYKHIEEMANIIESNLYGYTNDADSAIFIGEALVNEGKCEQVNVWNYLDIYATIKKVNNVAVTEILT